MLHGKIRPRTKMEELQASDELSFAIESVWKYVITIIDQ